MDAWQKMLTQDEQVMLVDSTDTVLGTTGKIEAHQGPGQLHRAITVFLFDNQGRTLTTQRSNTKPLWPGWWDAACSTHQWPEETDLDCARRRLPFELGIEATDLAYAFKYEYHAVYSPEWAENEVNHIVIGRLNHDPQPNSDEVADFAWKAIGEMEFEIANHHHYAPWVPLAVEKIRDFLPQV